MNLKFTIHGNPITKKNHQRVFRRPNGSIGVAQSKQYVDYEKRCERYIPYKYYDITFPVNLKCVYYMETRRRVDLCNLLAATCDILHKYGVINDDNSKIVVSHDGSRVFYDKENPRVEIEITEIGE